MSSCQQVLGLELWALPGRGQGCRITSVPQKPRCGFINSFRTISSWGQDSGTVNTCRCKPSSVSPSTEQIPAASCPQESPWLGLILDRLQPGRGRLGRWGLGKDHPPKAGELPKSKKKEGFQCHSPSLPRSGWRTCGSNLLCGFQCRALGKDFCESHIFQINPPSS